MTARSSTIGFTVVCHHFVQIALFTTTGGETGGREGQNAPLFFKGDLGARDMPTILLHF